MFGLNPMEMLIVAAIALLLFGNRLPSVARSLGKSVTEFKKGATEIEGSGGLSAINPRSKSCSIGRFSSQDSVSRTLPCSV